LPVKVIMSDILRLFNKKIILPITATWKLDNKSHFLTLFLAESFLFDLPHKVSRSLMLYYENKMPKPNQIYSNNLKLN